MGSDLFWAECDRRLDLYCRLEEEALRIIKKETADFPMHSYESRLKKRLSIEKKLLDRGKTPCDQNIALLDEELTDLLGLRAICLFRKDVYAIADALDGPLHVVERDDKNYLASPSGYQSYHLLAKLPNHFEGERYDDIKGLVFEVQVRTINMDAWAKLSHLMPYKSEMEVPDELVASFKALAGLYYVADTEFEAMNAAYERLIEATAAGVDVWLTRPLAAEALNAYLAIRFNDRGPADKDIFDLVATLRECGIARIEEVHELVQRHEDFIQKAESAMATPLTAAGMVRAAMAVRHPDVFPAMYAQLERAYTESDA